MHCWERYLPQKKWFTEQPEQMVKLQFSLERLVNSDSATEEVNMITNQGSILTTLKFRRRWQQTFTINRSPETKQLTEMLPGILNQFGADSLTSLRRLAAAAQTIWMEKHRSLLKR